MSVVILFILFPLTIPNTDLRDVMSPTGSGRCILGISKGFLNS